MDGMMNYLVLDVCLCGCVWVCVCMCRINAFKRKNRCRTRKIDVCRIKKARGEKLTRL